MMREGVDDCLPQPLSVHDVSDALATARRKLRRQRGGDRPQGQVVGFMRAKGGMGASTLALNTALANLSPALGQVLHTPGARVRDLLAALSG